MTLEKTVTTTKEAVRFEHALWIGGKMFRATRIHTRLSLEAAIDRAGIEAEIEHNLRADIMRQLEKEIYDRT